MELAAAAAAGTSTSAWDQPGTLGFLVVFGMAVVLYFVFRSLSRHLRKINAAARLEAAQAEDASSAERPAPAMPGLTARSPAGRQPGPRSGSRAGPLP